MAVSKKLLPVTVLLGFLGAGKTTVLNRVVNTGGRIGVRQSLDRQIIVNAEIV